MSTHTFPCTPETQQLYAFSPGFSDLHRTDTQYSLLNHWITSPSPANSQPEQLPYLDVAMGSCDDVDALPTLLVLQDTGVILSCQDKQQVLVLPLETKIMLSKDVLGKTGTTCPAFTHHSWSKLNSWRAFQVLFLSQKRKYTRGQVVPAAYMP